MLDIKLFRENPDIVKADLNRRKYKDKSLNAEIFPSNFEKKLKTWAKTQKNVEMRFWD